MFPVVLGIMYAGNHAIDLEIDLEANRLNKPAKVALVALGCDALLFITGLALSILGVADYIPAEILCAASVVTNTISVVWIAGSLITQGKIVESCFRLVIAALSKEPEYYLPLEKEMKNPHQAFSYRFTQKTANPELT